MLMTSVCVLPPSRVMCETASSSLGTAMYIAQNGGAFTSAGRSRMPPTPMFPARLSAV
jgi:hypothetical protein